MSQCFSAAMQCNSALQLVALIVICLCITAIAILATVVVIRFFNMLVTYHRVTVKAKTSSANVELDLSR